MSARPVRIAFVVSALASMGLGTVYALGGQTQWEGALLALALGALGAGLVMWAFRLPGGEAVEAREPLASSDEEREQLVGDWVRSEHELSRRSFVGWAAAAFAALGAALLFPIRSLGPSPERALRSTAWTPGARVVDEDGVPVRVDTLDVGGVVTVFPEGSVGSADAQTVLIRVDASLLDLPEQAQGWAPDGNVAYSKVCTHAGCPVGLFEQARNQLLCPCHQSTFDVLRGAEPVFGPATRPLPQLPIAADQDGFLVALSDYPEPIGPGFWDRGRA